MQLEPLKEDNLYTGDKPLEFILVPKCPLLRGFTVSDVVTASVYSGKTLQKKLMMMMIVKMIIIRISIMNKSQETTVFHRCQKLTSAMKQSQKSDGRLQV